ncbi:unnamed protein product [Brassicogethes aeneus]|uniref:Uncharacterized protein n=1 Tax=Brassicogethes aeneus TaxID=1431903 RepID=A0A9P0F9N0_BRAAE|nr:unnamed protein product [Brassicogethes aeneus]
MLCECPLESLVNIQEYFKMATKEFDDILKTINRKYEMIQTSWADEKNFEAKFRTQIPRDNEDFNQLCDEWVDLFSEATNTVWAKKISNTGPKIRFRKQYQCWTHGGKVVQKDLLFDARRCRGTLDVKVLTDNPLTRRKNKHIRVGLNVVVKINFNHLHAVDTKQPHAFFVHQCEPLAEAPKPHILPNNRLQQLVADMVQKGINSTQKLLEANNVNKILEVVDKEENQNSSEQNMTNYSAKILDITDEPKGLETHQKSVTQAAMIKVLDNKGNKHEPIYIPLPSFGEASEFITDPLALPMNQQTIMVQNWASNMETVKLELQPQLQPFTQLVVSGPQLDMSEHLLMFDATQVIPITANLNSHFVQLHNIHNQGQFL